MNKLPDSINPYNQFYWGGLSNKSEVYLYTRESIIRWNGNEFDKNWVFNKNSKNKSEGEIQTLIGVNERIFTKVWGKGLYELIDNEFQFIKGSELYSTNDTNMESHNSVGSICPKLKKGIIRKGNSFFIIQIYWF